MEWEKSWWKNFYCAKNVKKGSSVVACVFVGINTRERMSLSKISRVVVWQFMHGVYGDFELGMECVLFYEEYMLFYGSSGGFWDWGDAGK